VALITCARLIACVMKLKAFDAHKKSAIELCNQLIDALVIAQLCVGEGALLSLRERGDCRY
jgi:hypothetical protein